MSTNPQRYLQVEDDAFHRTEEGHRIVRRDRLTEKLRPERQMIALLLNPSLYSQ
jgi:hypothetical protein